MDRCRRTSHGPLPTFLFRVREQLFQPSQADCVLSDLRHQPEATAADETPADFGDAAVQVGRFAELLHVHGITVPALLR